MTRAEQTKTECFKCFLNVFRTVFTHPSITELKKLHHSMLTLLMANQELILNLNEVRKKIKGPPQRTQLRPAQTNSSLKLTADILIPKPGFPTIVHLCVDQNKKKGNNALPKVQCRSATYVPQIDTEVRQP